MGPVSLSCEIQYADMTIQDRAAVLEVLRKIARHYAASIVCFDAEKMAGRAHAEAALRHAHRSFEQGSMISNSFEMEALLYAAGTWECSAAVSFGLHEGKNRLFVCCCPDRGASGRILPCTCSLTASLTRIYPRRKPPGLQPCSI